jgi:lipoprotein-releasing system ATP-binding protein
MNDNVRNDEDQVPTNSAVLELHQVTKSFTIAQNRLDVLKGIDLTIAKGEAVAVVGPSGAGKTTMLNIAGGLMRPTSGAVRILGQDIFGQGDEGLSRSRNRHIGFVFQLHYLMPEFTAEENVALPALIGGQDLTTARGRARELLRQMGLENREKHRPGELSGGEQQRVVIARALINNPTLLLADEPTGDLDLRTAREIHDLFLRLNQEHGQTIVVVTHNLELAKLMQRTITIEDGLIVNREKGTY